VRYHELENDNEAAEDNDFEILDKQEVVCVCVAMLGLTENTYEYVLEIGDDSKDEAYRRLIW
jgi:hypothetical protein